ncbi:DUF1722 domain-containing protein [Dethiobacter alkaliphilus]|uniref:DUF1722 domain-containing protein n=1 Tax=Dethiobacter alkaliphilus AHT 1 TaxID=555088 RepID=C0GFI4_DETAL|nr:DUF1722 domain-containing protein [Dethiobacter alkaliphilus]EEG77944.1 conserved hypothetical protein [Dethiobacter alkaliphilus AHT 1]
MRVWDIHPGYLSRQSLLGQHAEIHAIINIIVNKKRGYAAHPETKRWKENLVPLVARHDLTVKEMRLRKFKHASPAAVTEVDKGKQALVYLDSPAEQFQLLQNKYANNSQQGRIPLPQNGSQFWAHHKYSIMARGYQFYKEIQGRLITKKDLPIIKETELIDRISTLMNYPPTPGGLRNVTDHLWGYFKKEAAEVERGIYLSLAAKGAAEQILYLFELAEKYQRLYLLHSTVFADLRLQE